MLLGDACIACQPMGSLDFVHDQMLSGRRFRVFNVVDDVTRECFAALPDTSISCQRIVRELDALIARRGKPGMIVSDNGTELTNNAVLAWCSEADVEWHYIQPGKAHAERLCGKSQRTDARRAAQRDAVPQTGPRLGRDRDLGRALQPREVHSSLGYETPAAYADELERQWPGPLRPTSSATKAVASTAPMRHKIA